MANAHIIKALGGLLIPVVSSDPSSPANGTIWYNSSTDLFMKHEDGVTGPMSAGAVAALDVSYDNATSGLVATTVQAAIDEVEGRLDTTEGVASSAQADATQALSDAAAAQADATQALSDAAAAQSTADGAASAISAHIADTTDAHDASAISFDPTGLPNLTGTDVQAALESVDTRFGQLDQDITDHITDAVGAHAASAISFSNGASGLTATTAQAAIDEVEGRLDTAESSLAGVVSDAADLRTLSGTADGATNLGTFTGSTIPDSQTVKAALQALETATELRALDSTVIKKDGSVAFTAAQSMGGFNLTNVADPTLAQHAATKAYVDAAAQGLKPKQAVRAATVIPGVLLTSFEDGDVIDTVTLATGDRILIKDQVLSEENGIYVVQASGAPVRATDFDSLSPIDEINGAYTFIQEGSQAGQGWVQQGTVAVLDTDPVIFVHFSDASTIVGGDMIAKTGNTLSVDLASDAGLESSNPGNSAGQLRVKLDGATLARSSSGLKITAAGVSEVELAASVAGAGLAGGAGTALSVNVDGSTIEIATDTLQVKDLGITNAKIATGVDAAKIADGSVSNAEFQYLANVSSDIQAQLDAKLAAITASQTLTASQTNAVGFTIAHASFEGAIIDYKIKEATTNRVRTGTLLISTDGTNTSISDSYTETGDCGVSWDLNISGADLQVRYTTTANNKVMKSTLRRFAA